MIEEFKMTEAQEESAKRICERYNVLFEPEEWKVAIGCDNAVVHDFGHIWIIIETDGYTHS